MPFIKRIKYNGKSILSCLLTFLWEVLFTGQKLIVYREIAQIMAARFRIDMLIVILKAAPFQTCCENLSITLGGDRFIMCRCQENNL